MNLQRTLFLILVTGVYYLLIAFIVGGFDIMTLSIVPGRIFLALIYCFIVGISIRVMSDGFLKSVPREEKVQGVKKYIGELHEELKLYAEAVELQRKVNDFKKNIK